ncbi:nuclear transport factor 2 family protein [Luteimonas sp. RD2P54]|uniref:Nuclear transport factor 2 family protein n=1 Tax=Luteimonas endophytica TaxID=3042023 RepID=A0ABT6J580_9GAMM|nr:nuclear transport factor 2 family protein [Luteimonas endophytica]MDH5821981.1 nuclear transport factor 2 family protein [Luteimonas endophytica]
MNSIEATVMQLEQALLDPAVRGDAGRLDALIADDFLEVGATGRAFGKAEVVNRLPGETGVVFRARAMQAHVLAADVVLVTYAAERTHQGGTALSLRSSVWVKNAGGWQMRYHQGTAAT